MYLIPNIFVMSSNSANAPLTIYLCPNIKKMQPLSISYESLAKHVWTLTSQQCYCCHFHGGFIITGNDCLSLLLFAHLLPVRTVTSTCLDRMFTCVSVYVKMCLNLFYRNSDMCGVPKNSAVYSYLQSHYCTRTFGSIFLTFLLIGFKISVVGVCF